MRALNIVAMLLSSLGAVAFGTLLVDFARARWGQRNEGAQYCGLGEGLGAAMVALSFLWFVDHLVILALAHHPDASTMPFALLQLVMTFVFPPMIATVIYADTRDKRPAIGGLGWKLPLVALWLVDIPIAIWAVLAITRIIETPRNAIGPTIGWSIGLSFAAVSVYAIAALTAGAGSRPETVRGRASRRSMTLLFGLTIFLTALLAYSAYADVPIAQVVRVIGMSLPLLFIFTDLYHANRFEFFDVLIKRGFALLLWILVLAAWFGLVMPRLEIFREQYIGPWLLAIILAPLALALPWVLRRLSQWVDSVWLGRNSSPADALKAFLGSLQRATDEADLVTHAEAALSGLFQAPVRIDLGLREAPGDDFELAREVPIRSMGQRVGTILMGQRANQMPYFSQDVTLLESLGEVFASALDIVRLQARKREQEQQAKELAHQASLSELKALRAQINPHFLFNALNAIAGLIHKDPFRADSTVEQLAEVFRYTLRGSENEWALLADEMEFVEAYLAVERARFGDRLEVRIDVADDVKPARIPTMVVQTLVENAIKHGVASVRGVGRVEVTARRDGERLSIEVADNGPGFDTNTSPARPGRARGASFGLKSIRERFLGYFGDRADLSVGRDEARGMTVARLTLPFDREPGRELGREPGRTTGAA